MSVFYKFGNRYEIFCLFGIIKYQMKRSGSMIEFTDGVFTTIPDEDCQVNIPKPHIKQFIKEIKISPEMKNSLRFEDYDFEMIRILRAENKNK